MTFPISLFLVQLQNLDPEINTELSEANQYQQIKQAVMDYSRVKPDPVTIDLTGNGTRYYAINATNFPGYTEIFSRISKIEYPAQAVSTSYYPVYLVMEDWNEDYFDGAGQRYLFLPNHSPASTETMRITFSGLYAWIAGTTTTAVAQTTHGFVVGDYVYKNASNVWVNAGSSANLLATHKVTAVADSGNFTATILVVAIPESDFFAVCNRAGALCCREIATRYSRTSDSTIAGDSVNHPIRAQMFAARAKEFQSAYEVALGISKDQQDYQASSEFVFWETVPQWPAGRRFLFHDDSVVTRRRVS